MRAGARTLSSGYAAVDGLLEIKTLIRHAARQNALGNLRAHVRRRCLRNRGVRRFSVTLRIGGQLIRGPTLPQVRLLGLLRATCQQRTRYRQQWKPFHQAARRFLAAIAMPRTTTLPGNKGKIFCHPNRVRFEAAGEQSFETLDPPHPRHVRAIQ
jgi:hypothetical protein